MLGLSTASFVNGSLHARRQKGTYAFRAMVDGRPRTPVDLRPPFDWDEDWYITHYPDLAEGVAAGLLLDPLEHYFARGYREGRSSSAAALDGAQQAGDLNDDPRPLDSAAPLIDTLDLEFRQFGHEVLITNLLDLEFTVIREARYCAETGVLSLIGIGRDLSGKLCAVVLDSVTPRAPTDPRLHQA